MLFVILPALAAAAAISPVFQANFSGLSNEGNATAKVFNLPLSDGFVQFRVECQNGRTTQLERKGNYAIRYDNTINVRFIVTDICKGLINEDKIIQEVFTPIDGNWTVIQQVGRPAKIVEKFQHVGFARDVITASARILEESNGNRFASMQLQCAGSDELLNIEASGRYHIRKDNAFAAKLTIDNICGGMRDANAIIAAFFTRSDVINVRGIEMSIQAIAGVPVSGTVVRVLRDNGMTLVKGNGKNAAAKVFEEFDFADLPFFNQIEAKVIQEVATGKFWSVVNIKCTSADRLFTLEFDEKKKIATWNKISVVAAAAEFCTGIYQPEKIRNAAFY